MSVCQVVQVYLSWVNSPVPVPRWTLVGFQRVTVPLNLSQRLSFTVTAREMAVWVSDEKGFAVQTGVLQFIVIIIFIHLLCNYHEVCIGAWVQNSA